LEGVEDLTAEQFNSISPESKASIEGLNLNDVDVTGLDFSEFTGLKDLNLNSSEEFTAAHFESISERSKASIELLDLSFLNVKDFNLSEFTGLKNLGLCGVRDLTATQFNAISSEAKASIESLDLSALDITDFDLSGFTNLKTLIILESEGVTAGQLNAISPEAKTSIKELCLGKSEIDVDGLDFSDFIRLEVLDLNNIEGLTATQFNAIPSEAKGSMKSLELINVNVTGFDFSEFTNLKTLSLRDAEGLTSLPENIGDFTFLRFLSLSDNRDLTSLPTSITNLSSFCGVEIEGCGISETVRERLQETANAEGYQGPRFHFSMAHLNPQESDTRTIEELLTNLYTLAKQEQPSLENLPKEEKNLKIWLSRLSYMADYNIGGERQESLAKSVVGYLEQANEDSDFRGTFLSVISGAADTCGDRMALSVVDLSIAHQIQTNDLSNMKSLAHLLSRGVWAMKTLEGIAREKVISLPFVDEVEVYLGYPTMLKDRLELPINIGEMLYFHCSGITQNDLNIAEEIVKDQLSADEEKISILLVQISLRPSPSPSTANLSKLEGIN
jgi:hypothetical protein